MENSRKRPISAFTYRAPQQVGHRTEGGETERGAISRNPLLFDGFSPGSSHVYNPYATSEKSNFPSTSRSSSRPTSSVRRGESASSKKRKARLDKRPMWNDRFYIRDSDDEEEPEFQRTLWGSTTESEHSSKTPSRKGKLSTHGKSTAKKSLKNKENYGRNNTNSQSEKGGENENLKRGWQSTDSLAAYDAVDGHFTEDDFRVMEAQFQARRSSNTSSRNSFNTDTGDSILHSYERSKRRIQKLWKETNVRQSERQDFEDNYFLKHPTHYVMETVFAYEQDLLHFKENTVKILRMIEWREEHINALKRYVNAYSEDNIPESGVRELRENLNAIISRIRSATLSIVEAVTEWRVNMTYPKPFLFDGENYLLKLQEDLHFFVESPVSAYASVLNQPFEEFNNPLGLSGITPSRMNSYQKKYITTTLPSLTQVSESDEEWASMKDRIYRAFQTLKEESLRHQSPEDESIRQINLHHSREFSEGKGSFFENLSSPSSKPSSPVSAPRSATVNSPSSLHLKNLSSLSTTRQPQYHQITFRSHYEANENSGLSIILDPMTARSAREMSASEMIQSLGHSQYILEEEELVRRHKAATKVQSVFKGWLVRKNLRNEQRFGGKYVKKPLDQDTIKLMHEALRNNSIGEDDYEKLDRIALLQSGMRAILAKKQHEERHQRMDRAALRIQTVYRRWRAVKIVAALRYRKFIRQTIMVQSHLRRTLAQQRYFAKYKGIEKGALFVQSVVRMRNACLRLLGESDAKSNAVNTIIRCIKAHLARKHFKLALERHRASTTISRVYRGHVARRQVRDLRREKSIVLLQSKIRTTVTSEQTARVIRRQNREKLLVVSLQSSIRMILTQTSSLVAYMAIIGSNPNSRSSMENNRIVQGSLSSRGRKRNFSTSQRSTSVNNGMHPLVAVERIQRAYRCHRARKLRKELSQTWEEELEEQIMLEYQRGHTSKSYPVPLLLQIIQLDQQALNK